MSIENKIKNAVLDRGVHLATLAAFKFISDTRSALLRYHGERKYGESRGDYVSFHNRVCAAVSLFTRSINDIGDFRGRNRFLKQANPVVRASKAPYALTCPEAYSGKIERSLLVLESWAVSTMYGLKLKTKRGVGFRVVR